MGLILKIAWRFLLAKKRAMIMSLAGITFGVAFFIVAQAQTSGFEAFFIQSIWGTNGALKVQDRFQANVTNMTTGDGENSGFHIQLREGQSYVEGIEYPDQIMKAVRKFREVSGASEVLRGKADAKSGFRSEESEVYGVRLSEYLSVSNLGQQVRYGSISGFEKNPQAILIGTKMADRLKVDVNGTLLLRYMGESKRFRVVGIFETGVEDYDKHRVFLNLPVARDLLGEPTKASFIQISLYDNNRADIVAAQMQETLQHDVRPWQKSEKTWLEVFRALRISSGITMSVIILVAALGMFNTLAIIVMERRREIAILRSMGYTRQDIVNIFVAQGLIVLAAGIVTGCLFAAGMNLIIENLPIRIRGLFSTDHFIVAWSIWHYVSACLVATVVVYVASYIPARRAARIEPGEIIRGAS